MSNELSATTRVSELPSYITEEIYDESYRVFDEVLEMHEAIADESHLFELAIWLTNKLSRKQAEKEEQERGELPRDYSHLYGFKVDSICHPAADERVIHNNMKMFLNALHGKI